MEGAVDMPPGHAEDAGSESPLARALARLEAAGIRYETVEHPPTYTAADEADAIGRPRQETAKTLVLLDHDRVRLAVIPASRRLDLDRARHALGASRHLRLATEDEVAGRFPAYEVGAVPAFAGEAIPELIDSRLLYHEKVLCSAGDHRHSVLLDPRDLFRLTEPRVADICIHEPGGHRFAEIPRV
jgi:Ala-tRNA(Pro) deacylase